MAGNGSFGSSKWTKKRRNKRLATEDVDNILKEAEAKKIRPTDNLVKNMPSLLLLEVNYSKDIAQVQTKFVFFFNLGNETL
jgi:hypothetical protein